MNLGHKSGVGSSYVKVTVVAEWVTLPMDSSGEVICAYVRFFLRLLL